MPAEAGTVPGNADVPHAGMPPPGGAAAGEAAWLAVPRRYLSIVTAANLLWEIAQLPLYTIWWEGTPGEIAFAVLHCTAGDLLIAGFALLGALILLGNRRWPADRYAAVAVAAVFFGAAYTIHREWLNTEIRGAWAYTVWMPTLPLVGTGLAPLAQWILLPALAFRLARPRRGEDAAA